MLLKKGRMGLPEARGQKRRVEAVGSSILRLIASSCLIGLDPSLVVPIFL
jgi:hypothetical protein